MTDEPATGGPARAVESADRLTWLRLYCEVCGGMGVSVENRVVGDVMVCEQGHKWISPLAAHRDSGERE
jgi:hypothetical protein